MYVGVRSLSFLSVLLVSICKLEYALSANVHLHWSLLSEQFFLLDPPGASTSEESSGDPFTVEDGFNSGGMYWRTSLLHEECYYDESTRSTANIPGL